MPNSQNVISYIGFEATDALRDNITEFLEQANSGHKQAGAKFVTIMGEVTDSLIQSLLIDTAEIVQVSPAGRKVINLCASTGTKVSGMLSKKLYRNASPRELKSIADIWENLLINSEKDNTGTWYVCFPIEAEFAGRLDRIVEERGSTDSYKPSNMEEFLNTYEELMDALIDDFFLKSAEVLSLGMVTRNLIRVGVDSSKKAGRAVLYKVIKNLTPEMFAKYVDHSDTHHIKISR